MKLFFQQARRPSTIKRALRVALVITPILTVFNHYQEIMALRLDFHFWIQVGLTFVVPYSVSTYSSAMTALEDLRKTERSSG